MIQDGIIANTIIDFVYFFQAEKQNQDIPETDNSYNLMLKKISRIIKKELGLSGNKYSIKGPTREERRSEIPWIAILNTEITRKETEGFYITYLFNSDFSRLYLSLNQGYINFEKKYKSQTLESIKKVAKNFRGLCNNEYFSFEDINLSSSCKLAKGYEAAHILGKYYDINYVPNEPLWVDDLFKNDLFIDDLQLMINLYENLINKIGSKKNYYEYIDSVVNCGYGIGFKDNDLEKDIDEILGHKATVKEAVIYKPKIKSKPITIAGSVQYPRDPAIAAKAIKISGYLCENDNKHHSFTRKSNNMMYTEAHHLIPLCDFNDFNYSLDIEANICSLCSECHNCLHYGSDIEKEVILTKLYMDKKMYLKKCGITITYKKLLNYYGIK